MKKTVIPVVALLIVGSFAFLAAPRGSATPPATTALTSRVDVATAPTATSLPSPRAVSPTATSTPVRRAVVAIATSTTPAPTATPLPTATPIPPSWHTVGVYSGTTAGTVAILSATKGPFRVLWTCQVSASLTTWSIAFEVSNADTGNGVAGEGTTCNATTLGGTFTFNNVALDVVGNWRIATSGGCIGTGCPPTGPWTATIEQYY